MQHTDAELKHISYGGHSAKKECFSDVHAVTVLWRLHVQIQGSSLP